MKRYLLTIICLLALSLLNNNADAGNVVITGRVNRQNTEVRLLAYNELLTWQPTELTSTITDDKGFFIIETNVSDITPAALTIGMDNVDFYLVPNSDFDIVITIQEPKPSQSYFERPLPKLRFRKSDDKGVNKQINTIDNIFMSFMLDHYVEICRGREYKYLDSIKNAINDCLPTKKTDFVNDYINYKIASLRLVLDADGGTKVKSEFFDKKNVLYSQPAYTELFKELFKDYFFKRQSSTECFDEAFHTSTEQLRQCLCQDPLLAQNEQLAEIVLIYNLFSLYNDKTTRKIADQHLKNILEHAKYPQNKYVVRNFFDRENRYANGANAPFFALKEENGNEHKLTDYQNTMLLLQFVDNYISVYDRHFERLKELQQQWNDSIQIITISTKEAMPTFSAKFKSMHIPWPLLNMDNNIDLLENYNIRMFPEYVIIKRNNKIGMLPAPSPDQFLDKYVTNLYGK